jgi:hypothetical protein
LFLFLQSYLRSSGSWGGGGRSTWVWTPGHEQPASAAAVAVQSEDFNTNWKT